MTTESDTPSSGEPGELSPESAGELFSNLLSPTAAEDSAPPPDTEIDPKKEPETPEPDPEAESNAAEEGDDAPITLTVDGKQVTLTKAELADAYKNGLRQEDYTKKTMSLAEQRKSAEAETQKAIQERQTYQQNLGKMAAQLEGALEQQAKIDWDALLQSDPVEYLKQQHLQNQRQAALQQNLQELGRIQEQTKAEQAKALESHLATQQQELLAKLPGWKDSAKAETERAALKSYLIEQGYSKDDVANINDHKAVVLSRKAMLYDQMIAKASAAAKKVESLPTKTIRPGVSTTDRPANDKSALIRAHNKRGSVESAAALFNSLI